MFYHAVETNMYAVLFELLKKSFQSKKRCLVHTHSLEYAAEISQKLWAAQDNYILPHGLVSEKNAVDQPILLTDQLENHNQAEYLFFTGNCDITYSQAYQRHIVIFDDHTDIIKSNMRTQFKSLKAQQIPITYYQQIQGKWLEKG